MANPFRAGSPWKAILGFCFIVTSLVFASLYSTNLHSTSRIAQTVIAHITYGESNTLELFPGRFQNIESVFIAEDRQRMGCFEYIQGGLKSFPSNDENHCSSSCKNTIFSIFKPLTQNCVCSNLFETSKNVHLSPLNYNCSQPGIKTSGSTKGIFTRQANSTGILIANYFQGACVCSSPSCIRMTCHPTEKTMACWVGPTIDILNRLSTKTMCGSNEYKITWLPKKSEFCNNPLCTYCLKSQDMYGFWPLKKCQSALTYKLHNSHFPVGRHRLYTITKIGSEAISIWTGARNNRTKVLILAEYRSGSTFTSELFNQNPSVSFNFEPEWVAAADMIHRYPQPNGSLLSLTSHFINYYNCDFYSFPTSTFLRYLQSERTDLVCKPGTAHYDCIAALANQCKTQDMTAAKTIALEARHAEQILKHIPDLKILVLLRDPRGMVFSQIKLDNGTKGLSNVNIIKMVSKRVCSRRVRDIIMIKKLQRIYPNQISIVYYEENARNQTEAAHHAYQSIGLGRAPDVVIKSLLHLSEHQTTGLQAEYATNKQDPFKTAYSWKSRVSFDRFVKIVDQQCIDSYKLSGYQKISSEAQLRNMTNYHFIKPVDV